MPFELTVPHKAFNRKIGPLAGLKIAPDGRVVSEAEWRAKQRDWLATDEDRAFVASLMGRVAAPGAYANWIAPPTLEDQQAAGRFRVRAVQLTFRCALRHSSRAW